MLQFTGEQCLRLDFSRGKEEQVTSWCSGVQSCSLIDISVPEEFTLSNGVIGMQTPGQNSMMLTFTINTVRSGVKWQISYITTMIKLLGSRARSYL